MRTLVLIGLLLSTATQSAPCVDMRRMISTGDFYPHFPTLLDLKRQFPASIGFACNQEKCYAARVGQNRWFVFHIASDADPQFAEIAEIAELSFPPNQSLSAQKIQSDASRMELAGLHLLDHLSDLRDMHRASQADAASMSACKFDFYEKYTDVRGANLRFSFCVQNGKIIALSFSDFE